MTSDKPRVSYKGTDMYDYAEQAWSTMSHSGLLMKYNPMQDACKIKQQKLDSTGVR
jgi:hypothetical protein